ncbi:DUF3885 domain-containing protein [Hymenobacter sp. BT18]|uniref:DUF3885 domain-containing protein n=1 Tax=Hymenobacter sp. BT18 TaxID=2835648 RepID=UPI00143E7363|nr:DUF3885 domain-containing protein [Hymenobacter sp. BT18]QIX62555.1 DUF3885 domain-containing protein [Hymenobacter sp. BT18]
MFLPLQFFLQQFYPKLLVRAPLFYAWPLSIRFDLQHAELSTSQEAYFDEVVARASQLFGAAFAPHDPMLVVYQQARYKRHRIRPGNYLLQQFQLTKALIHFQNIPNPYPRIPAPSKWVRASFETSTAQIPLAALLRAISNQDFGRSPALHGRLFFLNQRTGLVLHMYDDRGLDILGPTPASLRPLYTQHAALLLEYDRTRIDALFT